MADASTSTLATVPEDAATGLPASAKAAAEAAVKSAIAESVPSGSTAAADAATEDGEIVENGNASNANGHASGIRTVFSDPKNFNVVHPLYSKWCVGSLGWTDSG